MKTKKVNLVYILSRDKTKKYWYFEYGRGKGQRIASNLFTYTSPKTVIEKKHNKNIEALLKTEQAQRYLNLLSGEGPHKVNRGLKLNFLDFYKEWVEKNSRPGNRHAQGSLRIFIEFAEKEFRDIMVSQGELVIPAYRITEETCLRFRQYLTDDIRLTTETGDVIIRPRLTGDTPMNYFSRFRKMMKAAQKAGYFKEDHVESIRAKKGRENKLKDILTKADFDQLTQTPCLNPDIRRAFLFCCLTGIRGESVRALIWGDIYENAQYMTVIQGKTGNKVEVPILPQARLFLPNIKRGKEDKVFNIPSTAEGCNKILKQWVKNAGIEKHITWHCARHSIGTLLKKKGVSIAQIADILGQKSTRYAERVYSRLTDLEEKRKLLERLIE